MAISVIDDILEGVERWGSVVRVCITHTLGSSPRKAGADMIVARSDFCGSIGGGKLEYMALQRARELLLEGPEQMKTWPRKTDNFVLGTELRQCCGGVVWLLLEQFGPEHVEALMQQRDELQPGALILRDVNAATPLFDTSRNMDIINNSSMLTEAVRDMMVEGSSCTPVMLKDDNGKASWFVEPAMRSSVPLVIYGAGHVGRALVRVLEGTPFNITWVDIDRMRFPADVRKDVKTVIAADPSDHAKCVQAGGFHVVMTHCHTIDLEICRNLLETGEARYLGLIASKTKKSKFLNRLRKDGISETAFDAFHCPIGISNWSSKEPSIIAISIAAELVDVYEEGLNCRDRGILREVRTVGGLNEY